MPGTCIIPSLHNLSMGVMLAAQPAARAALVACLLVTTGSAYSTWRAAVTSPAEAMR